LVTSAPSYVPYQLAGLGIVADEVNINSCQQTATPPLTDDMGNIARTRKRFRHRQPPPTSAERLAVRIAGIGSFDTTQGALT
jgi:hypothetical protein